MVRNFGILNMMLHLPMRLDQYREGPLEVSFTRSAINMNSGRNISNDKKLTTKSKKIFIYKIVITI